MVWALLALVLSVPAAAAAVTVKRIAGFPKTCNGGLGAAASDGALWLVCEPVARGHVPALVRVAPSGKVSGPFPTPAEPYDGNVFGNSLEVGALAAGPAGTMWFTSGHGLVCRADSPGGVRCARTPQSAREAAPPDGPTHRKTRTLSITEGADGNMWMLQEANAGTPGETASIVRIRPDEEMTEFPLAVQGSAELGDGLVRSSSGDLWFGAQTSVGRVSPGGALTSYPLAPEASTGAVAALATSDGAVYFETGDPARLVRFTPSGTQSLVYPFPGSIHGAVTDLPVVTADGAVWLLAQSPTAGGGTGTAKPGAFYRVGAGGMISAFPLSGRFKVRSLKAGFGDLLWGLADGATQPHDQLVSVGADGKVSVRYSFPSSCALINASVCPGAHGHFPTALAVTPLAVWVSSETDTIYPRSPRIRRSYGLDRITA